MKYKSRTHPLLTTLAVLLWNLSSSLVLRESVKCRVCEVYSFTMFYARIKMFWCFFLIIHFCRLFQLLVCSQFSWIVFLNLWLKLSIIYNILMFLNMKLLNNIYFKSLPFIPQPSLCPTENQFLKFSIVSIYK